jgi:hypothetical protein
MTQYYQNNVFKELIEKYSTWDDMRKYLESEDGGLFRIADKNDDSGFSLIRYEKGTSKMDLPHSKWFRSVVWNTKTNQPVCVSPPKAAAQEFSFKTVKELSDAGIVCQELLDGFMINCFRVVGDKTLHITSRSKLNAAGKFYSDKTFRELFMEAYMNTSECPHYSETIIQDNSSDIVSPDSSKGEVAVFYSFLVQHKEHRIVKNNENNRVYVIHKGVVYEDGRVEFEDSPGTFKEQSNIENMSLETKQVSQVSGVSYAQMAARVPDNDEQSEVQKWIKNTLQEKDWQFQGLVFKDGFGNRWRFRSEKYSAVKALRGNSPTIRERFAQLYSQNLIHKYLEYYSDEMLPMTVHLMFMNSIIKMIYDFYVDLHITKVKKATDIDKMYLPHLYNIHGLYLSQLRPEGKKVNINEITMYLHKQPWQRIAFLIKKIVDGINVQADSPIVAAVGASV